MTEAEAKLACARAQPVVYRPYPDAEPEDGIIMRCNTEYAFVLYAGRTHTMATRFADLELANP